MPRRNGVPKRDVLPDPVYGSKVITKLVNQIMLDGKKGTAQAIVYDAFDIIKEKMNLEPLDVFNQALENVKPLLEVKARRVGGSTYQVPMEIRPERRQTLAIRWLVMFARKRSEKTMKEKMASLWTLTTMPARQSNAKKKCTAWLKRTRRSRTTAGRLGERNRLWQDNIVWKIPVI